MDQVLANHDEKVVEMRNKVEVMWQKYQSKRERRSEACREAPGVSFFGDNIGKSHNKLYYHTIFNTSTTGKVVNQRHNTGLEHKGEYLHMAQVLAIQNRIPSAHLR